MCKEHCRNQAFRICVISINTYRRIFIDLILFKITLQSNTFSINFEQNN